MHNFLMGINFTCGLIIVLLIEMGSFKSNYPKINYDSKTAKPIVKHTIAIIVAVFTISLLTKIQ